MISKSLEVFTWIGMHLLQNDDLNSRGRYEKINRSKFVVFAWLFICLFLI